MASSQVGNFKLITGSSPPPLTRASKYDAIRDFVLAAGDWIRIEGGDGTIEGQAQTLKNRYGDKGKGTGELEVITRGGELWARPRATSPAKTRKPAAKKGN